MNRAAFAGIVLTLMTVACQSLENTHSEMPLRELFASNQCAVTEAKLLPIEDSTDASRLMNTHRIGVQPPRLNIDSGHERMLLVAAGRKPSAGYRLQLTKAGAELRDGVLYLPVTLSAPDDGYQAAVITSPCLLLAVQRGSYRRIIVESLGLELELPEE